MPEGHTLHRLARIHQRAFADAPVRVSSPQGRFSEGAKLIDGRVFEHAEAWGKNLVHFYEADLMVHIHLGIYGTFAEQPVPMAQPVGQVRMRMIGERVGTDLVGPIRCDVIGEQELAALQARLGPDPLRPDAEPERAWTRISKSRTPIGTLMMDQKVIAGVGNIYRAEVLFRQHVHPMRAGKDLRREEWDAIWADLEALMRTGVEEGGIVVVRPEDDHGEPAYARGKPRTYVYRRAGSPCRLCGSTVLHAVLQARNLFWCPGCQP